MVKYEKEAFPGKAAIRWFNANCYEIHLPNGKTLLIDPFLPEKDHEMVNWRHYASEFTVNDIDRVDYILINSGHLKMIANR